MRYLITLAFLSMLTACGAAKHDPTTHADLDNGGFVPLFEADLSNATYPKGVWTVEDGVITASKDKVIMTKARYENFVLDLEFKNGPAANSGVIIYTTDPKNWIPNSIEVQIADDHAEKWAKADPKWRCGALFGFKAADTLGVVKPAGEWNRYTLTCVGQQIDVVLNGQHVNSIDLSQWTEAKTNPDGSQVPPWLAKIANADRPTKGHIGFQGKHGGAPIWFRNIVIKQLDVE